MSEPGVLSSCPICGAPLEATFKAYYSNPVVRVILRADGNWEYEVTDLGFEVYPFVAGHEEDRVSIYCSNDHDLGAIVEAVLAKVTDA